ncbi:DUF4190 domain-containing protein [Fluviicola taffensis]|uniref:DUF4190 domain-containing protein n=1 Tax=Fluviicola taffensis (strain DSM 16823 / NCIMB 13979 / RW262) TaxID=755732 RepID=F2I9U1_FLUTR|nr:DUF4190 domain-containing protein [Fluviicola taffensis]AEA43087.1 hypothetical protein Fluta_1090 [Fluviicola taffensis DSM 16823]
MKTSTFISFCLLIIALTTGCTIEKRLFSKGYHIEWKRGVKSEVNERTIDTIEYHATIRKSEITITESTSSTEFKSIDRIDNSNMGEEENQNSEISKTADTRSNNLLRQVSIPTTIERLSPKPSIGLSIDDSQPQETKKRKGMAISSLILGLLGISIIAITLGMIQSHRIRKHPDLYAGRGMAISGVLIGFGWLVFCCFFFLPFGLGLTILALISLLFFIYGLVLTIKNGDSEPLGIIGLILGWLGVIAATLFAFDL